MSQISISTTINAPISKVWECFTTPAHIQGWNNASPDWECLRVTKLDEEVKTEIENILKNVL
jgi:uncharacterized protein YndB with AHSA1/START domain